jgi:hypothetical protein
MTLGKFLVRTLVVAVVMFALGYVGHQLLLGRDYAVIEPIMRGKTDMQAHMPFALLFSLTFAAALVWIYSQGRSNRSWLGQGIRYGVAIWAISQVPLYLTNYVIEPWPGMFVTKILAWELIASVVLGVVIAALSKSDPAASERAVTA